MVECSEFSITVYYSFGTTRVEMMTLCLKMTTTEWYKNWTGSPDTFRRGRSCEEKAEEGLLPTLMALCGASHRVLIYRDFLYFFWKTLYCLFLCHFLTFFVFFHLCFFPASISFLGVPRNRASVSRFNRSGRPRSLQTCLGAIPLN